MKVDKFHDKAFKEVESIIENASDLIKGIIPENILKKLDLSTLTLENTSYTDKYLKEYFSDLVYNCKYSDKDIKISILIEHKSYVPKYPELQIFKYIIGIWDENIKQEKDLQAVLPIIFYHGKEKWTIRNLCDYFIGLEPEFKDFIPRFKYLLADLSCYSDKDIKEELFSRTANKILCLLFKHIFDEDYLVNELENLFTIGKNYFETEEGKNFLISVLIYIFSATEVSNEIIINKLNNISEKGGGIAMSTALRLKEEGIKEAKLETAQNMYADGVPLEKIVQYTGLSIEEIKQHVEKS